MEKGCMCARYDCDCYAPSNIPSYKEEKLLNHLWQIKAVFDSDSFKSREDGKNRLQIVINELIARGRI